MRPLVGVLSGQNGETGRGGALEDNMAAGEGGSSEKFIN